MRLIHPKAMAVIATTLVALTITATALAAQQFTGTIGATAPHTGAQHSTNPESTGGTFREVSFTMRTGMEVREHHGRKHHHHRHHRTRMSFSPAVASWYGPGLYGNGTACGQTLEPGTLGVANRTLPCGTKVTIRYNGHQVTVPVIDRGPYNYTRSYDLTGGLANYLGFEGVQTIKVHVH